MEEYNVNFNGYRLDQDKSGLPTYGGIYLVYCCVFNKETNRVSLNRLIYIGQSVNINDRLNNHERYEDFMAELKGGETLCYSYASVAPKDMNIVENALIFMQKPKLNNDLKDSFNYPNSQFDFEGRCALLKETHFSITSNN
jgi:excinuclease UvrABC nuclease subunit